MIPKMKSLSLMPRNMSHRFFSSQVESKMKEMLMNSLSASNVKVTVFCFQQQMRIILNLKQDVSGGCGAMYDIFVESSIFKVIN